MDPEEEMARQAEQMMLKKNKPKKQPLIKRDVNFSLILNLCINRKSTLTQVITSRTRKRTQKRLNN